MRVDTFVPNELLDNKNLKPKPVPSFSFHRGLQVNPP